VPEGDTLHRAARRLQVLVGQRLEVQAPHPRSQAEQVAERLDGRRLESVEAIGKNLVLRFDGDVVLRSHLRMSGRWSVRPRGEPHHGRPWLVLRGDRVDALLWNGPVLELHTRALRRLGPDILAQPPDFDSMLGRMRHADGRRRLGEIVMDQTVVSGIGNVWMTEALWRAQISPWRRLGDVGEDQRLLALETAARLMRLAVEDVRDVPKHVHRRRGRPCPRCGAAIKSWGQGDANRTVYWCPSCQVGDGPAGA
jgi:endonuclease-8